MRDQVMSIQIGSAALVQIWLFAHRGILLDEPLYAPLS